MNKNEIILVTGGKGLLGQSLVQELKNQGYSFVFTPSHNELDLLDIEKLNKWFSEHKPVYIFHLASLVYGLKGNMDNQLKSIHYNTQINLNVLSACAKFNIKKIFFAGTVAAYPYPFPSLPLKETFFLKGEPHVGEYGYAISKRHALSYLKILKDTKNIEFCYGILTNLYGVNDNFNTDSGHVIPSLIKKAYEASKTKSKQLQVWGNNQTIRDFLNSKDAAKAIVVAMNNYDGYLNIASGVSVSIQELVNIINKYFNNTLEIIWDPEAPIGINNRSIDNDLLISLGYKNNISLELGIYETIDWYISKVNQ